MSVALLSLQYTFQVSQSSTGVWVWFRSNYCYCCCRNWLSLCWRV